MQCLVGTAVVVALLSAGRAAWADTRPEQYAVGAIGGWVNRFTSGTWLGAAGGAEAVFNDRVGAGGELAFFTGEGGGLLAISANGSARIFKQASQPLRGFMTAGYSYLQFSTGAGHAVNVGAGVEYRTGSRRAVRVEFRDMVRSRSLGSHYWARRVGMTFR